MKNLLKLTVIFLLLFSCANNEPFEEPFIPDPTVIAEYHRVSSSDIVISKYYFDETGRFVKLHRLSEDFSMNFEYDSGGRITSVLKKDLNDAILESHAITYDAENRIASLDDTNFSFHLANDTTPEGYFFAGDYLTDDTNYNEYTYTEGLDPGLIETERIQTRLFLENNQRVNSYHSLIEIIRNNIETGEEVFYTSWWESGGFTIFYDEHNNVLSTCELENWVCDEYSYNTSQNPLYATNTNIQNIIWVLKRYIIDIDERDFAIVLSANSFGELEPPSDPDYIRKYVYAYEYNALDLPITCSYQIFIAICPSCPFELQSEWPYGRYYYQGDVIPE